MQAGQLGGQVAYRGRGGPPREVDDERVQQGEAAERAFDPGPVERIQDAVPVLDPNTEDEPAERGEAVGDQ